MAGSILFDKSKLFAGMVVKTVKWLHENKKEYILSKQFLRSGTSIGANLAEAQYAASDGDFVNKLRISLKECAETLYWIDSWPKTISSFFPTPRRYDPHATSSGACSFHPSAPWKTGRKPGLRFRKHDFHAHFRHSQPIWPRPMKTLRPRLSALSRASALFTLHSSLFTFLLAGCARQAGENEPTLADIPLPVRTIAVTNAPFERATTVQGTLDSVESAIVSARIPGPLLEVCVNLGDKVVAGETKLFAVDSATASNQVVIAREAAATARAQVAVAEANVAKAEAVAKKAVLDAERFGRLHGEERVSDNEWERAQTQRETSEADVAVAKASLQLARQQVSQAEAQLSIAERQLSDATLYAPCDGIVGARMREPGEQVGPGTPVIAIKGTAEVKALAFLPAQHYASVSPGETEVEIRVGGTKTTTKIAAKSPAIDPRLRVFEIRALLPGSDTAVAGAMADFRVVFEKRTGVSVPQEAVLSRAAGTVVFVARQDGTAKEVPVEVGIRDGGRAEILSGLAPGAPVVVEGQTQLYDGRKVEVK